MSTSKQGRLELKVSPEESIPLYWQIYWQLRQAILSGGLAAGSRLPASRKLAAEIGVARVTVTAAYRQLSSEGYVHSQSGAGTFVALDLPIEALGEGEAEPVAVNLSPWGHRVSEWMREKPLTQLDEDRLTGSATARRGLDIDFRFGGSFPHDFPYAVWRRLLARYLSTDDAMLSRYGSAAGYRPLRRALATYLTGWRGVRCRPEQLLIVSGVQQALDLLARILLSREDEVVIETPGYVVAYRLLQAHGANLVPVEVDEAGLRVEDIPDLRRGRMAFVTPANQFPRGGTMPLQRRLELLLWARKTGAYVIEDDYDSELRYAGSPLMALQGLDRDQRVIYLGSFSKVLFPALRLGYIVLPESLMGLFEDVKRLVDRGAPTLTQAAVADFIEEGHFERHLRHLRDSYGQRWRALIAALDRECLPVDFVRTPAGLHVMVYLDRRLDEDEVIRRAGQEGIGIDGGRKYHLDAAPRPSLLLGFSGLTVTQIEVGIERLAPLITPP